jgi:CheY-like chemotaxis protein
VTLPAGGSPARTADVPRSSVASRRGRIMVIDDEPSIVTVVKRLLSMEHEVDGTDDAHAALKRISSGETFDVILCDVMMPKMSGLELYRQLLAIDPAHAHRVMFLTGGIFSPDVREFLDSVENLRIEKPFDPMALRALINDRLKDVPG